MGCRVRTRYSITGSEFKIPRGLLLIGLLASHAGAASAAAPDKIGNPPQEAEFFSEMAEAVGIDFVHFNGMSGEFYFPEMVGAGGALLDYDNDGDLDVYLVQGHMLGPSKTLAEASFPPRPGQPLTDRLYRNDLMIQKDGTRTLRFTDVTAASRIEATGYGMGVAAGDFDNDGWVDLYVTHYGSNQLWRNNGDGTFADVTKKAEEDDRRWSVSAAFLDFDRDGWLDLFIANGAVRLIAALVRAGDPYPLHQPNQLLANLGNGRFLDIANQAGKAFALSEVSRGAAIGDVDNDGDADVLVVNSNGRARLLINNVGHRKHWLGLRLLDPSQRDAFGARVTVFPPSGPPLWRRVRADGSYASANDPRILVGLGETKVIGRVRVRWPSGRIEEWTGLVLDRYTTLHEGRGKEVPPS